MRKLWSKAHTVDHCVLPDAPQPQAAQRLETSQPKAQTHLFMDSNSRPDMQTPEVGRKPGDGQQHQPGSASLNRSYQRGRPLYLNPLYASTPTSAFPSSSPDLVRQRSAEPVQPSQQPQSEMEDLNQRVSNEQALNMKASASAPQLSQDAAKAPPHPRGNEGTTAQKLNFTFPTPRVEDHASPSSSHSLAVTAADPHKQIPDGAKPAAKEVVQRQEYEAVPKPVPRLREGSKEVAPVRLLNLKLLHPAEFWLSIHAVELL